jgi:hypothetical protein
VTGAGGPDLTVPKANVSYTPPLTNLTGATTTGQGIYTGLPIVSLSAAAAGATWTAGVGVNTASFNPSIGVILLNSNNTAAVAGTYTGTISQSVA